MDVSADVRGIVLEGKRLFVTAIVVEKSKVAQSSSVVIEKIMKHIIIKKAYVRDAPDNVNVEAVRVYEFFLDRKLERLLKKLSPNRNAQLSAIREAIRLGVNLGYLPAASLSS